MPYSPLSPFRSPGPEEDGAPECRYLLARDLLPTDFVFLDGRFYQPSVIDRHEHVSFVIWDDGVRQLLSSAVEVPVALDRYAAIRWNDTLDRGAR